MSLCIRDRMPVFVPCPFSLFSSGNAVVNYMERTRVNARPTYSE